jgi:hypothetical protein
MPPYRSPHEDCPECGGIVLTSQTVDHETARLFEYKGCIACRWVGDTIELDSVTGKPLVFDQEEKLPDIEPDCNIWW